MAGFYEIADRVIVLAGGRIVATGTPLEALTRAPMVVTADIGIKSHAEARLARELAPPRIRQRPCRRGRGPDGRDHPRGET